LTELSAGMYNYLDILKYFDKQAAIFSENWKINIKPQHDIN